MLHLLDSVYGSLCPYLLNQITGLSGFRLYHFNGFQLLSAREKLLSSVVAYGFGVLAETAILSSSVEVKIIKTFLLVK